MKKENVMRKEKDPNAKDIVMSIRINKSMSKFMKENKYSPQLIFLEALKDLGFKQ